LFAGKDQGTKPMIGFGDPVFARDQTAALTGQPTTTVKRRQDPRLGASVDRAKLADALSPLPDSAVELKAIAAKLVASSSDI